MKAARFAVATLALLCGLAHAEGLRQPLPLGTDLVRLDDAEGARLLLSSSAREAYWPLSIHFVTQSTQSYCGVASMVMVLNALAVPAPAVPGIDAYAMFTQDNVLNAATEQTLPQAVLLKQGMTLDQFGQLIASHGVQASVTHAGDSTLNNFRDTASSALATPRRHVVVNYLRRGLGQERGGHISPLAAYDAATDRFLLLDVARYKYPPVWVKAADLFAAMNTIDSANEGRTRGYVVISPR